MNLYFVVVNEMLTSVIPSQVIAPARSYSAAYPSALVRLVFLEPARVALRRSTRERLRQLRSLWPEGRFGLYPYIGRLGEHSPALILRKVLQSTARSKPVVLHCRGPEATIQGARAVKGLDARVIFDARGAGDHEAVMRLEAQGRSNGENGIARAFEVARSRDQKAASEADAVTAVSQPLASRLRGMLGNADKEFAVIPCCVERSLFSASVRAEMRGLLELAPEELLFIHVSTEARWEAFDQVLAFFREVQSRRRSRLLFLTTLDADLVTASINASDPLRKAVIVQRAEPVEVGRYLSAADVGLLIRRPHEAFRVASPIKFAEYLGAGLAVVASEGIGETAQIVSSNELGVVVPAAADSFEMTHCAEGLIELLDNDRDSVRLRAIRVCESLFVWQRYISDIARLYGVS